MVTFKKTGVNVDRNQYRALTIKAIRVVISLFLLVSLLSLGACKGNVSSRVKVQLVKGGVYLYDKSTVELDISSYELCSTLPAVSGGISYVYGHGSETVDIVVDESGVGIATFYDPLIIQLPDYVQLTAGSYRCELGGLQLGDLIISRVNRVPVTPEKNIFPERGHQLYIVDFPEGVNFAPVGDEKRIFTTSVKFYNEHQGWEDPSYSVKILSTGKFTIGDHTYYLPIYPAETNFARLPAMIFGRESHELDEEYTLEVPDMSAFPYPEKLTYDLRTPRPFGHKLYYPLLDCSDGWQTELALINNDDSVSLTGTMLFYSDFGQLLAAYSVDLKAHGRREFSVINMLGADGDRVGYAVFEYLMGHPVGYANLSIRGRFRAAVPALADSANNQGEIFIPHIDSSDLWWTRVSFINTSVVDDKEVRIKTNNNFIFSIPVLSMGRSDFKFSDYVPEDLLPTLSSAKIINGEGIIGVELFGSTMNSSSKYLGGVQLSDDSTTTMYYPHTVSDDIWWTGVVGYNPQKIAARVTVTPYRADGKDLSDGFTGGQFEIGGEEKYIGAVSTLKFPVETAWFKLDSTQPLTGFELFGKVDGSQLAGYTSCNIDKKSGIFPKLEKAGWTGIAFVNIGAKTTNVHLYAYNDVGDLVAQSKPLILAANEKKVGDPRKLFEDEGDISLATYIVFDADSSIVGFQLNSSDDEMMLDGLPAL